MSGIESQIVLVTSCLMNQMQNTESNYFLSLPQITKKSSKPNEHLLTSIFNYCLRKISIEVSGYGSFMDFADQIQFLSKCNSCTTVGIQW